MTPFERQPPALTLTAALVAVALVVLVLASTSARRADTTAYAATVAAVATATVAAAAKDNGNVIRPFRVNVPEAALVDLRRRIAATQWPERETVRGCIAGRAARDDSGTRALLGRLITIGAKWRRS